MLVKLNNNFSSDYARQINRRLDSNPLRVSSVKHSYEPTLDQKRLSEVESLLLSQIMRLK